MEQTEQEHGPLRAELELSLAERDHGVRFSGAARLARHYASLIDNAAPSRSYAKSIRVIGEFIATQSALLPPPEERELLSEWDKVSSALAEHSVASDLGPKLLAAMAKLELTLAEPRAAAPKPATAEQEQPPADATPIESKTVLQLLRGDARARNANAS